MRQRLTNHWVAIGGLLGVGLLPCPDCGAPLAVHTWPIALLIWAFRRIRQRQIRQLDLILQNPPDQHAHEAADPE